MKHVSGVLDHDVVIVSIANAEYVGGDTIGGARFGEVVDGEAKLAELGVMKPQPVVDAALLERVEHGAFLYLLECLGVGDHLDEAALVARLKTRVREYFEVEAFDEPELAHHVNEL